MSRGVALTVARTQGAERYARPQTFVSLDSVFGSRTRVAHTGAFGAHCSIRLDSSQSLAQPRFDPLIFSLSMTYVQSVCFALGPGGFLGII